MSLSDRNKYMKIFLAAFRGDDRGKLRKLWSLFLGD